MGIPYPPYVYLIVRGIAVDQDEEDLVRRDVAKRLGDDYVVMLGEGTQEDPELEPEEVPDAAA